MREREKEEWKKKGGRKKWEEEEERRAIEWRERARVRMHMCVGGRGLDFQEHVEINVKYLNLH